MSLERLLNQPCTLVQRFEAGDTDEYGNEVPLEELVDSVCAIEQRSRAEPGGQGEVSATEWLALFPAGTVLGTDDAVVVDGLGTFELVGEPEAPTLAHSHRESHVEATLSLVKGAEDS